MTAVHITLAEYAARADGDLRLNDVIPRAQRIALGIEEGEHALTLIVMQEVPENRHAAAAKCRSGDQILPLQSAKQHHQSARSGHQQSGAQIGLLRDDEDRGQNGDREHANRYERGRQGFVMDQPRTEQRYGKLHDFRRLKAHHL